jgi:hypothetical protein
MVRSKGKRSMTIGERQDIEGLKAEAEATLRHAEENKVAGSGEMLDKTHLKREIARYDEILHEGAPVKVRGVTKDKLISEARELEDKMQKYMPTREEMAHPERNPGAVQKHIKWGDRNKGNIQRYKEIMRTLEPDDPTATSIDRLRRDK